MRLRTRDLIVLVVKDRVALDPPATGLKHIILDSLYF